MPRAFVTAAVAFAATNVDDLFVLMLLFGQAINGADRWKIIAGQYVGVAFLTAVSLMGALGLGRIPAGYLRLLGLIPLALGVRAWKGQNGGEETKTGALSVMAVAALTVANGGDNIGVYLPLFIGMNRGETAVTVVTFALLCGLWCLLGSRLASLPGLRQLLQRHKGWLVPVVFILLGVSILL